MYGIVNLAIEQLVKENFGEDKWDAIKEHSGVDVDYFLSNEPYDDDITFKLATSTSEILEMPLSQVLIAFGEYWILKTGKEKYGSLMEAGGENFKEFLVNLPMFHNRIMLIYPKLTPPEFQVTDIKENSLLLHYFSKRMGLNHFVEGLVSGLAKMYKSEVIINQIQHKKDEMENDIFYIEWKN